MMRTGPNGKKVLIGTVIMIFLNRIESYASPQATLRERAPRAVERWRDDRIRVAVQAIVVR